MDDLEHERRLAVDLKRKQILALCKQQADEGAHYLWGAEGLRPTGKHPYGFANMTLSKSAVSESTFCAATTTADGLVSVCAGRCFHPLLAKGEVQSILIPKQGDALLLAFIDKYQDKKQAQYNWGFTRTPRKVRGNAIDYATGKSLDNQLVWGEGCDDTLHFDCGGFVRWIVKQICADIAGISQNPSKKNAAGDPLGTYLKAGDVVGPADILVYDGHVAFATGDMYGGTPESLAYRTTTRYLVAQADCAVNGVNYRELHKQDNQHCIRLSDSTLIGK